MNYRKKEFVNDLKVGSHINSVFVVAKKIVKKKKNGDDFCLLTLQDREGDIQAVVWTEALNQAADFKEGDFVAVAGSVSEYRSSKQLTIESLSKIEDKKNIDYTDFIKSTKRDVDEMFAEIKLKVDSVKNHYLKQLLQAFFGDKKFAADFCKATAAVQYHHAYGGGLLEHTLYVCRVCDLVADTYQNINRDLLIAGALLHDIGKMKEYEVGVVIKFTDEGKLLGHITMGYSWVLEKINQIKGFPADLKDRILHIILSHHGYKEFGSPKRPKILEAFIVHHVDYMDAEIAAYNDLFDQGSGDEGWSHFVKNFERSVLLRKLDDSGHPYYPDQEDDGDGEQEGLF